MSIKKRSRTRVILTSVILVLIVAFIILIISMGIAGKHLDILALNEVTELSGEQAVNIGHNLSFQFNSLETLSLYISENPDMTKEEADVLLSSFLSSNKLCTAAYTDEQGNIIASVRTGSDAPTGNISERDYYKKAQYWEKSRAMVYMSSTSFSDDPRVIFAVPITRNHTFCGVLFCSTKQEFFEEKIWSGSISENYNVFIINSDGQIFADVSNSTLLKSQVNLYDVYLSDSETEEMKTAIENGKDGNVLSGASPWFPFSKNKVYLSYKKLEDNDWYVVSVLDYSSFLNEYRDTIDLNKHDAVVIAAVLCLSMSFSFIFIHKIFLKNRDALYEQKFASRKVVSFLEQSGNASFEFDIRNLALKTSEQLDRLLGYTLPENWFAKAAERQRMHPEFDYSSVISMYSDVLTTLAYKEMVQSIFIEKKGLRWLKISMAAVTDMENKPQCIFGVVSDITEEYMNKNMEKEEQEFIMNTALSFMPMVISGNVTENTYSMINHASFFGEELPWKGRADELIEYASKHVSEALKRDFLETFSLDKIKQAYKEGESSIGMEMDVMSLRSPGLSYYILAKAYFIDNKTDDDIRVLVVVIDLTQSKEYEHLLKKRYDLAIENMPGYACKWLIGKEDIILLDANRSFFDFMNAPKEEVLGRSIIYGFDDIEKKQTFDKFFAQVSAGKNIHHFGHGYKYNGEEFWMTVNGSLYEEQDGLPVYYCIINDVTNIIRMQEQANYQSEELKIASRLSGSLVIKYDIAEKKLHVLANGTPYSQVHMLDGHAPEYALEIGIVPNVAGTTFYNAITAVEQGSADGEFRFMAGSKEASHWLRGRYQTVFNRKGEPVSAILLISDDENKNILPYEEADAPNRKPVIRSFGYFDILVDGRPVVFSTEKAKEMLAVLVDRRGGFVSSAELISCLWEDESANKTTMARCRQVASRLKKTLDDNGIGDIVETVNGLRRIIPERVSCDLFDYYSNRAENSNLFDGAYMSNYSWGEMTLMSLEKGSGII